MRKITREELEEYVVDVGEQEKEHREYSSFYITISHTINEGDLEYFAQEQSIDASGFLGIRVVMAGIIWDDASGCDWDSTDYYIVEKTVKTIPERIIPAHEVVEEHLISYKPKWS